MRETQNIVFDVAGQSILHRVEQGRPSSASFAVYGWATGDNGTAEFSGTATVDAPNTTLSSAASTGATSLSVVSATGIVTGRLYLLSENSLEEWVEPVAINGTTLTIRYPTQNAYTTSAALQSTYVTAAVDGSWVADEGSLSPLSNPYPSYRCRFSVTVGGTTHPAYAYLDLIRTPVGCGVTMHDLADRWYGFEDSLPERHRKDRGRALIASALRAVRADLVAYGVQDDAVRDPSILDELVLRRMLLNHSFAGHAPSGWTQQAYGVEASADYNRFLEQHFQINSRRPLAVGTTGAASQPRALPIFRK